MYQTLQAFPICCRSASHESHSDAYYQAEATELDNAWVAAYVLLPYAQAAVNNYETNVVARYIFQRLYGISQATQQADETWPPGNQDMMNDLETLEGKVEVIILKTTRSTNYNYPRSLVWKLGTFTHISKTK